MGPGQLQPLLLCQVSQRALLVARALATPTLAFLSGDSRAPVVTLAWPVSASPYVTGESKAHLLILAGNPGSPSMQNESRALLSILDAAGRAMLCLSSLTGSLRAPPT